MPNWDIFHSDRLEVERNLSAATVRAGMASGAITPDDLTRPNGSSAPWARLADHPEFAPGRSLPADAPTLGGPENLQALLDDEDEDEDDDPDDDAYPASGRFVLDEELDRGESVPMPRRPSPAATPELPSGVRKATTEDVDPDAYPDSYDRDLDLSLREPASVVALDADEEEDFEAEDDEAAEFTLARGGAETVEELDLAAMVDVAFQLVLFFLVTASTVVFKTLEVPKPNPETKDKSSATQGSGRTIEQLQDAYIIVEIDPNGGVKIDHANGPNDFNGLVAKLREIRKESGRDAMLLTADSLTQHKYAVLAYDAANEIGLKIAIATPKPNTGGPAVPPAAPK